MNVTELTRCRVARSVVFILLALAMVACSANGGSTQQGNLSTMSLEVVHTTGQCGQIRETQWITTQADFNRLYEATRRAVIAPSASQSPKVDFEREGVLVMSMGQQRTGGYALKLTSNELVIDGTDAVLHIHWQEPRPGMMVTQVLTNPCVFIKVPRGGYTTLRVLDQDNKVRAQVAVN